MSLISWYIRYNFKKGDRKRDAGLSTPPEIQRYDDIVYGESKKWQILDVYRPKDKAGKLPVILSVHGGGWVYGTKETYQFYCMDLAKRGFAVVNFTYRLAPEHRYPAQIEDTNAVVEWILKHSEEYGFDTDNSANSNFEFGYLKLAQTNVVDVYASDVQVLIKSEQAFYTWGYSLEYNVLDNEHNLFNGTPIIVYP